MTSALLFRDFYEKRMESFQEVSRKPVPRKHGLWEEREVHDELKKAGLLDVETTRQKPQVSPSGLSAA